MFSRSLFAHAIRCICSIAPLLLFSQFGYSATCTYSVVDSWNSGFNAKVRIVGSVLNYDQIQQQFIRYNSLLGDMASTGTTNVDAYGGVRFKGSEKGSNIFSISTAQLQAVTNIDLYIPTDALAVINVEGNPLSMGNFSFNANGTQKLKHFKKPTERK